MRKANMRVFAAAALLALLVVFAFVSGCASEVNESGVPAAESAESFEDDMNSRNGLSESVQSDSGISPEPSYPYEEDGSGGEETEPSRAEISQTEQSEGGVPDIEISGIEQFDPSEPGYDISSPDPTSRDER
ncbi:MAG: hypothetical protein ACI3W9_01720 [Eubacteriales bacterium]